MTLFLEPRTLPEACQALEQLDAYPLAGGVAFTMALTKGEITPQAIVSLRHLHSDMYGVAAQDDGGLRIRALTTHRDITEHPAVANYETLLPVMFADVGNVRVRAAGTLGGNLGYADPRHDPAPLLAALGATVTVASPIGSVELPIEELATGSWSTILQPGQLITHIQLPARTAQQRCGWSKLQSNSLDDYATVSVAVSYEIVHGQVTNPRIFLGAADTHVRPLTASATLEDAPVDAQGHIDGAAIERAAETLAAEITPSGDHRGSESYKRTLAQVALRRALRRATEQSDAATPEGGLR